MKLGEILEWGKWESGLVGGTIWWETNLPLPWTVLICINQTTTIGENQKPENFPLTSFP